MITSEPIKALSDDPLVFPGICQGCYYERDIVKFVFGDYYCRAGMWWRTELVRCYHRYKHNPENPTLNVPLLTINLSLDCPGCGSNNTSAYCGTKVLCNRCGEAWASPWATIRELNIRERQRTEHPDRNDELLAEINADIQRMEDVANTDEANRELSIMEYQRKQYEDDEKAKEIECIRK